MLQPVIALDHKESHTFSVPIDFYTFTYRPVNTEVHYEASSLSRSTRENQTEGFLNLLWGFKA